MFVTLALLGHQTSHSQNKFGIYIKLQKYNEWIKEANLEIYQRPDCDKKYKMVTSNDFPKQSI